MPIIPLLPAHTDHAYMLYNSALIQRRNKMELLELAAWSVFFWSAVALIRWVYMVPAINKALRAFGRAFDNAVSFVGKLLWYTGLIIAGISLIWWMGWWSLILIIPALNLFGLLVDRR